MNAITTTGGGGSTLIPQNLDQAMRLAEFMARGKMVPDHLRNPSDALMVIEQAMRWSMSPYAVAQCTSVIQGKLMFSGTLVSAAVHSSGILDGRLTYTFAGEGDARSITVHGTIRGETEPRDIIVRLRDAKTTNQMWTKQPDQQLCYFATRAWARRHTPEVMLGVYSPEEFDAPSQRPDAFAGTTIDSQPEATGLTPRVEVVPEPDPMPPPPRKPTITEWLDALGQRLERAADLDAVEAIATEPDVVRASGAFRNGAKKRLDDMVFAAMHRTRPAPPDGEGEWDGEAEPSYDNAPENMPA